MGFQNMKFFIAAIATICFAAVLAAVYLIHVYYFQVNVVLYSAVIDGIVATFIVIGVGLLTPFSKKFTNLEKAQLAIIWLLLGYVFAITGPAVIDRSLSFYILEKLQQRGGGIRQADFEYVFTKEYVKEHRLVDVRLTEQLESGTIVIKDGCVLLTDKGQFLATASRYFRTKFLPKKRLLMGVYSDDLTDPFRSSVDDVDYRCR